MLWDSLQEEHGLSMPDKRGPFRPEAGAYGLDEGGSSARGARLVEHDAYTYSYKFLSSSRTLSALTAIVTIV